MTSYHGGKQRQGKYIAQAIYDLVLDTEEDFDVSFIGYCEPFCGMLGVYRHVVDLFGEDMKYKAGDYNKSVVLMWNAVKRGWHPPVSTTRAEYDRLRYNGKSSAKKGFIGHQYSFGGQYFHGMSVRKTNYPGAAKRVEEIGKLMARYKVVFKYGPYTQYSRLKNWVIYCDPPYAKFNLYYTDSPKGSKGGTRKRIPFSSEKFWDWARKMSKDNLVIISEYSAPSDFVNVFSTRHRSTVWGKKNNHSERLFIHESWT